MLALTPALSALLSINISPALGFLQWAKVEQRIQLKTIFITQLNLLHKSDPNYLSNINTKPTDKTRPSDQPYPASSAFSLHLQTKIICDRSEIPPLLVSGTRCQLILDLFHHLHLNIAQPSPH